MSERELPPGWAWATLGEVSNEIAYGTSAKTSAEATGVPVLRMGNIVDGRIDLSDLKYLPRDHDEFPDLLLENGDLLFNRTNSPELVGKSAIYRGHASPASFASYLLRVRTNGVLTDYAAYWINSQAGRAWIASVVSQQVGQANVNSTKLRAMKLPVPPLAEQRRIVAKLDELLARSRRAREALDEVPALVARYRESLLASAFRGDLTADWREAHPEVEPASALLEHAQSGRGVHVETANKATHAHGGAVSERELPPGWAWATLGDVIDGFETGRNLRALGRPAVGTEVGVLKISAVTWGTFRPKENKALMPGDQPLSHERVRRGDLLITRANTAELVGAVVLVDNDHPHLMLPDKILRIVYNTRTVSPPFLLHAMRSRQVRRHFETHATGTSESMRNLSQPKLATAPLVIPPLAEQHEIVRRLEAAFARIDAVEAAVAEQRAQLDAYDRALLAQAFSGELVPQDPSDEPASVMLARLRAERDAGEAVTTKRGRRAKGRASS